MRLLLAIALALITALITAPLAADDWPQWRGPTRDAVSAEKGLLQTWPAGGPPLVWQAEGLGDGYSSVVVGDGRLFTLGRRETAVIVTALDAETGQPLWSKKIGETERHPCSTPTLDGDRLYVLDPDGELVCLAAKTGEILWQMSYVDDFAGRKMSGRGYGESPLVDGELLICTPGGPAAGLVAIHKHTGDVRWRSILPALGPQGADGAGFSSVVVTEAAGFRQYVQLVGRGLVGVDARDGRFLWGYNAIANDTANIPTPLVSGDLVFAANGYSAGSVLLKLVPGKVAGGFNGVKAEVVYELTAKEFQNHHGGVLLLGEHLYGGHGNNNGLPTCLELKTGNVAWKRRGPGTGSAAVLYADGRLYFRYQNGLVALLEASPRGYQLAGSFEIPGAGGDSWAHAAIANGRLYLREQDKLYVYDVRSSSDADERPANAEQRPENRELFPYASSARFRKLNATVEHLSPPSTLPIPPEAKKRRRYGHAFDPRVKQPALAIVTFTAAHLTPQGTLKAEPLAALDEASAPLVASFAGANISDAGLKQLASLELAGLDFELCGELTDAGLKHLAQSKSLRVLILTGTKVTHAGLAHFAGHPNLTALDLELCDGITDDACDPLAALQQLKQLGLKKSGFEKKMITDQGLGKLTKLSNLQDLNLYGNHITDAGLAHLAPLKQIRDLDLSLLAISDAGLKQLAPLTELRRLELLYSEGFAGPKLTSAAVDHLRPLTNLTTLNLTGAHLTDEGLQRLTALRKLQSLQIVRTKVTADGIKAFQSALPDCELLK